MGSDAQARFSIGAVLAFGRVRTLEIGQSVSMYSRTKGTRDNLADTTFTDRPNNGKHMQISLSTTFIMIPSLRSCHTVPQRAREWERKGERDVKLLCSCLFTRYQSL